MALSASNDPIKNEGRRGSFPGALFVFSIAELPI